MILKIALTKGRVEEQFMELLDKLQIDITPFRNKQRKLIIDLPGYQFILAKGPDVMTFVNRGVVDLGIVGSDLLMEQGNERNELMDLKIGQCQFILASVAGFDVNAPGRKTIGTRYPRVAARYFDRLGQDVEIIKIEGSVELAPLIQLTDAINTLNKTQRVFAHEYKGKRYDVGNKFGWIETNIEYGLNHPETKTELREYIKELGAKFVKEDSKASKK